MERRTRYVLLAEIADRTTNTVTEALEQRIKALPAHLIKSLTWDQGRELAAHKRFTANTNVQVYFCDPRSPWQRGSNENTNGLLRDYFPKGTDLSAHTAEHLLAVENELNSRPRIVLDDRPPQELFTALLAS